MEKQTRMNKYKELREKVRAELEVELKKNDIESSEDDYLSFISKNNISDQIENTVEIDAKDENYDKKLEILNIIKGNTETEVPSEEKKSSFLSKLSQLSFKDKFKGDEDESLLDDDENTDSFIEQSINDEDEEIKEVISDNKNDHKKMTFLEKLAALSVKEEDELDEDFNHIAVNDIEEETDDELEKELINPEHSLLNFVSLVKDEDDVSSNKNDEDGNNVKLNKIIDFVIIVLMVVLFIFLFMIIMQLFS